MSEHTTLYRLYNKHGVLLYVGISGNPGRRFSQHAEDKLWWGDVADVKLTHFGTRQGAEIAERQAIQSEHPIHNIRHSTGEAQAPILTGKCEFTTRWHPGPEWEVHLTLFPEIDLEPYVEDLYDESGEDQFWYWVKKVQEKRPDEYAADAVPIHWYVDGGTVFESAPFQPEGRCRGDNFLSFYTWPVEDGHKYVDWYSMPVVHDRFPKFAAALGWSPAPLQPTCPLKSIVASKLGRYTEADLNVLKRTKERLEQAAERNRGRAA